MKSFLGCWVIFIRVWFRKSENENYKKRIAKDELTARYSGDRNKEKYYMNGILLDNWSLEEIIGDAPFERNAAYINLLEVLVLWDDIYFPDNKYSFGWKNSIHNHNIKDIIVPFPDNKNEFQEEAEDIFNKLDQSNQNSRIIGIGGIRYSLFSNEKGLDYFPSADRCEFLSNIDQREYYSQVVNRYKLLHALDKEVQKYYDELSEFLSVNTVQFELPLLAQFVIQNTPCNMSHIQFAIQLREDKSIKRYRKYLNRIEIAFNNGNWNELFHYENATKEIVHDIFKEKTLVDSVTCGILALPSINFSLSKRSADKYVHLNFLKKLAKFAYERHRIS